jgi:hypothetical protein
MCEATQLRLLEDWRQVLGNNTYVAAKLIDISKTFDCLSHGILLDKLKKQKHMEYSLTQPYISQIENMK